MAKADEENTALMLLTNKQETALDGLKKQNNELKKGIIPLGIVGIGAVASATGAVIGFGEGYKTQGKPESENAIRGVAPAAALVIGGIGAVAAGPNNPKLRGTAAGVAIAGGVLLARDVAHGEGVAMALQQMKDRPAPPAAPQAPAVQGFRR